MSKKYEIPTIEKMLEAGVHFGHQAKRWNPKMEKYIYSSDSKTHVIDIYQTQKLLEVACGFLYETAKSGKQIVLVGTKRQSINIIEKYAKESDTLFVNQRWLGGTFTNFESVRGKWKELQKLTQKRDEKGFDHYTKKERLLIDRKIEKLELFVGGIQDMKRFPGALVVVDVKRERTAVREANMVNVPVVGLVDTNSVPDNVDYVIPANDDAIKSIELLVATLSSAIASGYKDYKPVAEASKKLTDKKPAPKRLADRKPFVKKKPVVKKKSVTKKKVAKKPVKKTASKST